MTSSGTTEDSSSNVALRAWYVSEHRLPELFEGSHAAWWARISSGSDQQYRKIQLANSLAGPVISFVRKNKVPSLVSLIEDGRLGNMTTSLFDGVLCGKGFSGRSKSPILSLTSRKGQLPNGCSLRLGFSQSGLVTETAFDAMSGTKHLFALASIQNVTDTLIEAVPFIVGNLVRKAENGFELPLHSSMEVAPDDIDQFSGIDFTKPVSKRDQDQLRKVPEKRVKEILCGLFGESHIQNDWGGEDCDLFTRNVRIKQRPISAAFLLKGPARFHEMTMADCGKNGDQIVRLFNTEADLLVIQHCHRITSAVQTHVRNAAIARMSAACRYMFLDGSHTVNILRHVGDLH